MFDSGWCAHLNSLTPCLMLNDNELRWLGLASKVLHVDLVGCAALAAFVQVVLSS